MMSSDNLANLLGITPSGLQQFLRPKYLQGPRGASWYENWLDELLQKKGVPLYYRQFHIGQFRIDFLFPTARIALEVNGIYHEMPKGIKRDNALCELLKMMGFVSLWITTTEMEQGIDKSVKFLTKLLWQRHEFYQRLGNDDKRSPL